VAVGKNNGAVRWLVTNFYIFNMLLLQRVKSAGNNVGGRHYFLRSSDRLGF
jgi:hypothetical protein